MATTAFNILIYQATTEEARADKFAGLSSSLLATLDKIPSETRALNNVLGVFADNFPRVHAMSPKPDQAHQLTLGCINKLVPAILHPADEGFINRSRLVEAVVPVLLTHVRAQRPGCEQQQETFLMMRTCADIFESKGSNEARVTVLAVAADAGDDTARDTLLGRIERSMAGEYDYLNKPLRIISGALSQALSSQELAATLIDKSVQVMREMPNRLERYELRSLGREVAAAVERFPNLKANSEAFGTQLIASLPRFAGSNHRSRLHDDAADTTASIAFNTLKKSDLDDVASAPSWQIWRSAVDNLASHKPAAALRHLEQAGKSSPMFVVPELKAKLTAQMPAKGSKAEPA